MTPMGFALPGGCQASISGVTLLMTSSSSFWPSLTCSSIASVGVMARSVCDDDGFCFRVVIQGFGAVLLAEPALLDATKWQFVVDHLVLVDPGVTRLQPLGCMHCRAHIARPDRRAETKD